MSTAEGDASTDRGAFFLLEVGCLLLVWAAAEALGVIDVVSCPADNPCVVTQWWGVGGILGFLAVRVYVLVRRTRK